ncbi:hypothetical protein EES41_17120 [Streptomyces sp. ADI95-16]|uniref:DUF6284 family protein n=1 Tax=Streptomyces sp. ADI95-16 TaxID=1522758 RepID=UPI000F3A8F01|nr:DUF6284 family protein [Streptomyces sp. ADI95-16]AYV28448.1 hypothetical protein EES41_17120 [Streptomyces sp. ADI95-16]
MKSIAALQSIVTSWSDGLEPSDAELGAIEVELPLILAERDLLDALIAQLDRPASEFDARRIRRARNRVLAARRCLANRAADTAMPGDAA